MTLVHKDEVAALERFHRDAHAAAALFLNEFGYFDHEYGVWVVAPKITRVNVKMSRRNARSGQFLDVLFAQALVRRDEQNVVQRPAVVVQKLVVVQVQEQGLAAAGRHPIGQFGQIVLGEGFVFWLDGQEAGVALVDKGVQVGQQLRLAIEEAIQDDFGVERGQILKIAQGDLFRAAAVDLLQVSADVFIVKCQILGGNFHLTAAGDKMMVEKTASVGAKAFGDLFAILQHGAVALVAEKAVEPGQENQAVFQFDVLLDAVRHVRPPALQTCVP